MPSLLMENECVRVLREVSTICVPIRIPVLAHTVFEELVIDFITWIKATPVAWPKTIGLYVEFTEDHPGCACFALKLWDTHLLNVVSTPTRFDVSDLEPAKKLLLAAVPPRPAPDYPHCVIL